MIILYLCLSSIYISIYYYPYYTTEIIQTTQNKNLVYFEIAD